MESFNYNERGKCRKFSLSHRLQQLEENFKASGGKFIKCKLEELFKIKGNPQLNKESFTFSEKGIYPYFTRTVFNNGILGYVDYLDDEHKISGNTIAVGMLGMQFFYMEKDFYAGQFTKTLYPKISKFNESIALYFIGMLNKLQSLFQGVLVRDFEKTFYNTEIVIPQRNNQIDFDYMEERIRVLEEERIRVLESYLKVSGLTDCNLAKEEEKILHSIQHGNIKFKEFKLEDILNWQPQKEIDPLKIKELTVIGKNKYPFYGQATINNGIISYECLKSEVLNNTLSSPTILIHSNNQNCVYLETPFYLKDGHGATSVLQNKNLNELNAQFLISCIKKVIITRFSYDEKATKIALKNTYIQLPVSDNNQIDYAFMETYIRAIEKKVIKNVIDWKDAIIEKTKEVVA